MSDIRPYRLYSTVVEEQVEWLWYPYIPCGKITLLQGDPGDGKSTFMINLVASLTRGKKLPDGQRLQGPVNVVYQCAEDSTSDTIKPRLNKAGADCDMVAFIEDEFNGLNIGDARIEQTIKAFQAKLLILDPLQAFMPTDFDMQSAGKMRQIMSQLARLAARTKCAVVLIGHMNKASSGKKLYRGLGSIDIAAIARSVLMISRDPEDTDIRYMYPVKSSLAPEGEAMSFVFDRDKGFQWIGKCAKPDFEEPKGLATSGGNKKTRAAELLKIMLSDDDLPSVDILQKMNLCGIGERTTRAAYKEIGGKAYRKDGMWYWTVDRQKEEGNEAGSS